MLTVKLFGGLGNQLFQYAYGRGLELRGQAVRFMQVGLLPSSSTEAHHRDRARYGLDGFKTKVRLGGPSGQETARWDMTFDPAFLDLKGDVTLAGHWQCEKYFLNAAHELRHEIVPVDGDTPALGPFRARIAGAKNSVALHVRRGDYTLPENLEYHGVCSREYYQAALDLIRKRRGSVSVFIFSDDPAWCRTSMSDVGEVMDTGNRYWDLHLISLAQDAVIANSTFSWWGAWTAPFEGQRADRIVVAPKRWFVTPNLDARDIVPDRWIKL